jgi:hypothetical protein
MHMRSSPLLPEVAPPATATQPGIHGCCCLPYCKVKLPSRCLLLLLLLLETSALAALVILWCSPPGPIPLGASP